MTPTTAEDFTINKQGDMFGDTYKCKHCGCIFTCLISPHYARHRECGEKK